MSYTKSICKKQGRLAVILSMVMVFFFIGALPAGAFRSADIQCGDTIGPNERVRLRHDIGPCEEIDGPVLTIVGPAIVNLRGHTVSCYDDRQDGILIEGKGVRLYNGTVAGCDNGVVVDGDGKHMIKRITAQDNTYRGFHVYSDNNRFLWNRTDMNGDDGFYVQGRNNKFVLNKIIANEDEGFETEDTASGNRIVMNTVKNNYSDSYEIHGEKNRLVFNRAINGEDEGFEIEGDRNVFRYNWAHFNEGNGFQVEGNKNSLARNRAKGNTESGILVEMEATDNVITRNSAWRNGTGGTGFDIEDENDTEVNKYRRNRFNTSNQEYIQ